MRLRYPPTIFILSMILISINSLQASDGNGPNRIEPIKPSIASISINVDTLYGNVSKIRQSVESISHNTEAYVEESQKEFELNQSKYDEETCLTKIGLLLSFLSVVAVIYVYLRTRSDTNKQIEEQHNDTIMQIEERHKDTKSQIVKMQEISDERTKNLEDLGKEIQNSTNEIKTSVKKLEQRFMIERDKTRIEAPYSSIKSNYDALCKDIENEYSHFTANSKNSIIHQRATKIKENIGKVTQILSSYSESNNIPDAKAYIDSIDTVVEKPNFQNKREQINSFKNEGQKYNNQLTNIIQNIFYKNKQTP